jgi:hypothetical protein
MTDWAENTSCEVVECDPATRKPKPGGEIKPAVVERVDRTAVRVRFATGATGTFYRESLWQASPSLTEMFRWRLMPPADTETEAPRD